MQERVFRPRLAPLGFSHHERTKYREDGFEGPAKCVPGTAGFPAKSSSLGGDVKIEFALLLRPDNGARSSPSGNGDARGRFQPALRRGVWRGREIFEARYIAFIGREWT